MNINKAFPSKWLAEPDLDGKAVTVTMSHVVMEKVRGDGTEQPVLYFRGKQKGLVLNKTNATVIANAHGDEMDDWGGQTIILFPTTTELRGKTVPCIRVKLTSVVGTPDGDGPTPGDVEGEEYPQPF